MKERIKIKLAISQNAFKGPSFRLFCDEKVLDECVNYNQDTYENSFDLDLEKGRHQLIIEHFGKHPRDTDTAMKQDVAVRLVNLTFNGVKCDDVDLHENYFYPTKWPYPLDLKIKNNLYFGFNGQYRYCFETPATGWVLAQKKKHQKQLSEIEDFQISEDEFITRLEAQIKKEANLVLSQGDIDTY